MDNKGHSKLGPRFYGPFMVPEKIAEVTYRIELLAGAKLHNVFHVGLLKPFKGTPPATQPQLPAISHGHVCTEPESVLKGHLARGVQQVLVQWKGQEASSTSWMLLSNFQQLYPKFQLEDELFAQKGEMSCAGASTLGAATKTEGQPSRRNMARSRAHNAHTRCLGARRFLF
jgi:hypothetical protein